MTSRIKKAVFPVAGLGTRSLPATKAMAKEMQTIVDRPLIQYALDEARDAGIEDFIFVTGRGKSIIEDHFDHVVELEHALEAKGKTEALEAVRAFVPPPGHLYYTRQQAPLGLGHAVWCARGMISDGEPFAVILPDDLILAEPGCLRQMVDAHAETGGNMVAVEDVPRELTSRYGILDVDSDDGKVAKARGLVEKPKPEEAPSTLSIIGRYILDPAVFAALDRQETGAGGEIQLTDAMAATIDSVPFHGLRFEGRRYDCGNKQGFIEANIAFGLARDDVAGPLRDFLKTVM
jgi:UTP--glucose-1-phosphate uridylyltransferase